jgi:SAM-dependent methyltransferase
MAFKDYFSGHAASYRAARPTYPPELFAWLASQCAERQLAWDAGCGNGQASVALTEHFDDVYASDPSHEQIAHAIQHPDVAYRVEPAEECGISDHTCDLVLIAQALHWVDLDRFYAEVRRVLKPGGVVAAVSYGLMRVNAALDHHVDKLYHGILGPYWPAERKLVDEGYRSLPFPFTPIEAPPFAMKHDWTFAEWLAYIETWSALQRCRKETGHDPLAAARDLFLADWGDANMRHTVAWPLALRVGRV